MKKTIYINPSYARENKPILDHIEHNQNFVISPIEVLHDIKSSIDHIISLTLLTFKNIFYVSILYPLYLAGIWIKS